MRRTPRSFIPPLLVAFPFVLACLLTSASAQEGPFSNASLHGTYAYFIGDDVTAEEPFPNRVGSGLLFYDGNGNYRAVGMYGNQPGEPDAEGNATRNLDALPTAPETWLHFSGTAEVTPQGYITLTSPFGDFHGTPIRAEMVGEVLILVEYRLVAAGPNFNTGGAAIFSHTRLVDENILPPAPDESE